MSSLEGLIQRKDPETLRSQFGVLRRQIHQFMETEEETRLKENPKPTEEEIYMAAFKEWLEPQVRDAIALMYRKGYASQSSGFHGTKFEVQQIDGLFTVDESTRAALNLMGVEVLRGADIGAPNNKLVTILRFRAKDPSIAKMKEQWDAIAAALPKKQLPSGIQPICDRVEIFREEYAPDHASLEATRDKYIQYLRTVTVP
ncbi:hypothetical protein J4G43_049895 [Bradyrhizobium barranii subsp. barranii]|uniref:Uncharacterized protein n=2 Tax=Bradyrhizobium TaxID=374 RepID=A0A939M4A9_9BRAD|nr:hypothetical protein [Bradyrhizobium barranii]UEM12418.1 hypothetical protein J4G43_049895 [Bradyrhizobium barranii subsp. barranii]